jgi:hypothetical protein
MNTTRTWGSNWYWNNNLRIENSTLQYYVYDSISPEQTLDSGYTLTSGAWYNIIITQHHYSTIGTGSYKSKLYIDGTLHGMIDSSGGNFIASINNEWKIGGTTGRITPGNTSWEYAAMNSNIDQFIYYNAEMNDTDVLTFYNTTKVFNTIPYLPSAPTSDIFLLYNFDEPTQLLPDISMSGALYDISYSISTENRWI